MENKLLNNNKTATLNTATQNAITTIAKQLNILKDMGQLPVVFPILEKTLQQQPCNCISTIVIDSDYRIFLPEYNHTEIKIRHLSKAIYLLFLSHPNGIYLPDLHLYKNELLRLYCNISNQISLDKIQQSINSVVAIKNGQIYQHLSRIKTAFIKQTNAQYAENYYINGAKNQPKKIALRPDFIIWKNKQ